MAIGRKLSFIKSKVNSEEIISIVSSEFLEKNGTHETEIKIT